LQWKETQNLFAFSREKKNVKIYSRMHNWIGNTEMEIKLHRTSRVPVLQVKEHLEHICHVRFKFTKQWHAQVNMASWII
jgi:hypothetical protein